MSQRRKITICIAAFVAVLAVIAFARREKEPEYQDRSLSEWMDLFCESSDLNGHIYRDQATKAVRGMGTNVLPILFKWLPLESPEWSRKVLEELPLDSRIALRGMLRADKKAQYARIGFSLLSSEQRKAAMPGLTQMVNNTNDAKISGSAISVLLHYREDGVEALAAALSDTSRPDRPALLYCIGMMGTFHSANPWKPHVAKALNDQDPKVRSMATNIIDYMRATNRPSGSYFKYPKQQ